MSKVIEKSGRQMSRPALRAGLYELSQVIPSTSENLSSLRLPQATWGNKDGFDSLFLRQYDTADLSQ